MGLRLLDPKLKLTLAVQQDIELVLLGVRPELSESDNLFLSHGGHVGCKDGRGRMS